MCDLGVNSLGDIRMDLLPLPGRRCGIVFTFFGSLPHFDFPFSHVSSFPLCFSNPYCEFPLCILPYLLIELDFTPISVISPFPFLGSHMELKT